MAEQADERFSPYEEDGGVLFHRTGGIFKKMSRAGEKLDGPWVQYHPNGQLQYEGMFRDGRPDGPIVMYYDNGQVFKKGAFKDGLKDGTWSIYDSRGVLLDEVTFENGRAV